jgi:hypothetical protein
MGFSFFGSVEYERKKTDPGKLNYCGVQEAVHLHDPVEKCVSLLVYY